MNLQCFALITSHHITSHHITSHHITSHHITSHHITSHPDMLCLERYGGKDYYKV